MPLSAVDQKLFDYVSSQERQNKKLDKITSQNRIISILTLLVVVSMFGIGLYLKNQETHRERALTEREKAHSGTMIKENESLAKRQSNILQIEKVIQQKDSLLEVERMQMILMKRQLLQTESFQRNKPK